MVTQLTDAMFFGWSCKPHQLEDLCCTLWSCRALKRKKEKKETVFYPGLEWVQIWCHGNICRLQTRYSVHCAHTKTSTKVVFFLYLYAISWQFPKTEILPDYCTNKTIIWQCHCYTVPCFTNIQLITPWYTTKVTAEPFCNLQTQTYTPHHWLGWKALLNKWWGWPPSLPLWPRNTQQGLSDLGSYKS